MANLLYALEKNVFDGSVTMAEMAIKKFALLYCRKNKNFRQVETHYLGSLFAYFSSSELERYSDKYTPSVMSRPTLKRKDLHAPLFPSEVSED